jgi:hypothetical protein
MTESKYIVDIFQDIVDQINDEITCYYLFGHPQEVVNTLSEWTKDPSKKFERFPLICLFQDFEEVKGVHQAINSKVTLNMVICMNTLPSYKSSERYTNTFKPVIYPLYDHLIMKIEDSYYFAGVGSGLVPHTKIDRVFWGKNGLYGNTANHFNDYIDAIEIQNLELEILNHSNNC